MQFYRFIVQYRLIITIFLALIGIGLMAFYTVCDTACSYLQGDLLGLDLKYVGVAYMAVIIVLAFLKQADLLRMLVASGIGVEVFLVSFQIRENVFCPFCLCFGIMVILMYFVNYERSSMSNKWHQKIIYVFGDAEIPLMNHQRLPLLIIMIVGYLFVLLTFSGSATPAYAAENTVVPSYGKGSWELIVFTDYFCPPCQSIEKDLEPELERLLARGDVKITFVDYPGHKDTTLYAKYFLYVAEANAGYQNILKARRILFSLARQKNINQEKALADALKSQGVALKIMDPKPVYKEWMAMIKRYDIDQTPTCLLRFSSAYNRKFSDADQIQTQLLPELKKRFSKEIIKSDISPYRSSITSSSCTTSCTADHIN